MIHLIFFNFVILIACWGKPLPLLLAGLANLIALVEWHVRNHAHQREIQSSISQERLKTMTQFKKGEIR